MISKYPKNDLDYISEERLPEKKIFLKIISKDIYPIMKFGYEKTVNNRKTQKGSNRRLFDFVVNSVK